MYPTKTITAIATDGTPVKLTVPVDLPTEERAEHLRRLFAEYVHEDDDKLGWKGPVHAAVPDKMADDVAEAMEFMGCLVDERRPAPFKGTHGEKYTFLASRGYYAHGF